MNQGRTGTLEKTNVVIVLSEELQRPGLAEDRDVPAQPDPEDRRR